MGREVGSRERCRVDWVLICGGVQFSALGKVRLIPHRDKYYTIHFITRLSF